MNVARPAPASPWPPLSSLPDFGRRHGRRSESALCDEFRRRRYPGLHKPARYAPEASASAEMILMSDPRSDLEQAKEIVRQVQQETDPRRRIELCRRALALVAQEQHPAGWAALQRLLAGSLYRDRSGERA